MGEAFDAHGHRLGAVTGATKQDVFNELNRRFPDASVITIRSQGTQVEGIARRVSPIEQMQQQFDDDLRARREKLARKGDG